MKSNQEFVWGDNENQEMYELFNYILMQSKATDLEKERFLLTLQPVVADDGSFDILHKVSCSPKRKEVLTRVRESGQNGLDVVLKLRYLHLIEKMFKLYESDVRLYAIFAPTDETKKKIQEIFNYK